MAAIKTKERNRMITPTLDDRMMVQSNGPAVTEQNKSLIDKLLCLACDHWSLSCTRMPSRSHPGVSRPRASASAQTDVLDVLSGADRQSTGSAMASSVGRADSSDDEDGEELEHDEDPADAAEEARVSAENLSKIPPFVITGRKFSDPVTPRRVLFVPKLPKVNRSGSQVHSLPLVLQYLYVA